ncbi:MAG: hypothetical protein IPJ65_11540 [Archangiaceae bacterium]|nr:hypothetical protein [Archangiaceae bacterium]
MKPLGPDQLELLRPARPSRLVFPLFLTAVFGAGLWFTGGSIALAVLVLGVCLLPLVTVKAVRASVSKRHVLVRSQARLLLDGEPIEAARIEVRVVKHWLLRRPHRYALSLWALVGRGEQIDVELGQYPTMLEASTVSGQMEDFLERAKQRTAPSPLAGRGS